MSDDAPLPQQQSFVGPKQTVAVIASLYNTAYVDSLLNACTEEISAVMPNASVPVVRVPGAFEIPAVASHLAASGVPDVIVALGVVIRGDTAHADLVGESVTRSLQELAVAYRMPIIHEVLLLDNDKQAEERCMGEGINRGTEAGRAAVNMAELFHKLGSTYPLNA